MAFEDLGQVLRKSRTRQYHVAADFVGFLLQFALHVGDVTDHADAAQFLAGFSFSMSLSGWTVVVLRSITMTVGCSFGALENLGFRFDDFHRQTGAACGVFDLDRKKQVV